MCMFHFTWRIFPFSNQLNHSNFPLVFITESPQTQKHLHLSGKHTCAQFSRLLFCFTNEVELSFFCIKSTFFGRVQQFNCRMNQKDDLVVEHIALWHLYTQLYRQKFTGASFLIFFLEPRVASYQCLLKDEQVSRQQNWNSSAHFLFRFTSIMNRTKKSLSCISVSTCFICFSIETHVA